MLLILQGEHVFFPFLLAAFEGLKQYASYNKLQRASLQLLAQAGGDATLGPWNFGDVFSFASNFGACQELAEEQVQEGDLLIFKRFCAHRIHLARCDHNDCYPSRCAGVARCLFGH